MRLCILLVAASLLSACGLKGDLYIEAPENNSAASKIAAPSAATSSVEDVKEDSDTKKPADNP